MIAIAWVRRTPVVGTLSHTYMLSCQHLSRAVNGCRTCALVLDVPVFVVVPNTSVHSNPLYAIITRRTVVAVYHHLPHTCIIKSHSLRKTCDTTGQRLCTAAPWVCVYARTDALNAVSRQHTVAITNRCCIDLGTCNRCNRCQQVSTGVNRCQQVSTRVNRCVPSLSMLP